MCFVLADHLGLPVQEVENWPIRVLREWYAYFLIKKENSPDGTGSTS